MSAERGFLRETFNGHTRLDPILRTFTCIAIATLCKGIEENSHLEQFSIPLKHFDIIGNVSDLVMIEGARQMLIWYGRFMQLMNQKAS